MGTKLLRLFPKGVGTLINGIFHPLQGTGVRGKRKTTRKNSAASSLQKKKKKQLPASPAKERERVVPSPQKKKTPPSPARHQEAFNGLQREKRGGRESQFLSAVWTRKG